MAEEACNCRFCEREPGHEGKLSRYKAGCRCQPCRDANSEYKREDRRKRNEAREVAQDSEPGSSPGLGKVAAGIEGDVRSLVLFFATMWAQVDAFCGGVLVAQAPAVAKSLAKVAADDPAFGKWLAGLSDVGKWGGVAFALMPVGQAITVHHVFPMIQHRRERMAAVDIDAEVGPWEPEADGEAATGERVDQGVTGNGSRPINPHEFVQD